MKDVVIKSIKKEKDSKENKFELIMVTETDQEQNPSNTLFAYIRVSTSKQLDNYSLETQKDYAISKTKSLGLNYLKLFNEQSQSATKETLDNRPILNDLLEEAGKGNIKYVYVIELSRLIRNVRVASYIYGIFKNNKCVLHTGETTINFNDPIGVLYAQMASVFAEYESEAFKSRSKRGLEKAAYNNKWSGNGIPYGLTRDDRGFIIPDKDEVKVLREIISMYIEKNYSTSTIANVLNERGIQPKSVKVSKKQEKTYLKKHRKGAVIKKQISDVLWQPNTILSILKNPILKGFRNYKGQMIELNIEPVVNEGTWNKIQETISNHRRINPRNNKKHTYLLRTLIRCGKCGENMFGVYKENKKEFTYKCSSTRNMPGIKNCGNKSPNLFKIEGFIWNVLCDYISNTDKIKKQVLNIASKNEEEIEKINDEIKKNNKEINKWKKEIDRVVWYIAKDNIDKSFATKSIKQREKYINKCEENINKLNKILEKHSQIKEMMFDKTETRRHLQNIDSIEEKRGIVEKYIENIYVKYDPELKDHKLNIQFSLDLYKEFYSGLLIERSKKGVPPSLPYRLNSVVNQQINNQNNNNPTINTTQRH